MEYSEILHRCFRCGYCKMPSNYIDINCPSYLSYGFETFSPGGRMWLIRAWLDNKINNSERFQEILYSCANCGNCTVNCAFPKFKDLILLAFQAAKEKLVEKGTIPPKARDYLTNLYNHGNPYAIAQKKRSLWAKESDIEQFSGHEYLLFVDDVGAFDERGKQITLSIALLLKKMGISFGILGNNEISDGNDALSMGEKDLFEYLAKKNIKNFQQFGVKKIITISPHSFNSIKKYWHALDGNFQVYHYTQIIALFKDKIKKSINNTRVCFHDPCYLGRHNLDFNSPRVILNSISGIVLNELERNRQNALCCGGGGGNFYTNILSPNITSAARVRVHEALKIKAEIIAVACPICCIMLEDAIKVENLENQIKVKEISEIISIHHITLI